MCCVDIITCHYTAAFKGVFNRVTQGAKIYFNTPRLKALLALNLAIASASAMVIVNTVVLVQAHFKLSEHATTWAFGAFGLGSMLAALLLPKILEKSRIEPSC